MAQIFISYANEDKAWAKKLASLLEEEGWTVWWDRKILVGDSWRDSIKKELNDSKCVLVLWSRNSVRSHWVIDEAEVGAKRGILIPIVLGDVDLPLGFGSIQAARLPARSWKLGDPKINVVRQSIAAIVGPAATRAPDLPGYAKAPLLLQSVTTKSPATISKVKTNEVSVVRAGRFEASATTENKGNLLKYRISERCHELRYGDVMQLWKRDQEFVDFYISIFKKCGFQSYVWETPSVSKVTIDRIFEFVLFNVPQGSPIPDRKTYASYFDTKTTEDGIVAFSNLGGDAVLVVPSPFRKDANYADFAAFYREAPLSQQRALWKELSRQVERRLSDNPVWISVSSGISWLHVRLDSSPKYYRYSPYISS